MEDLNINAPSSSFENAEEIPQTFRDSGRNLPLSSSIPTYEDHQAQMHRSKRASVFRCRFEIVGKLS